MDMTRKGNREAQEALLQYESRQEAMLDDELIEDKLTQLLAFINQLKRSSEGNAELQHRVKVFGVCKRGDGQTSAEFYGRLRHWLDRNTSRKQSPRQPPRQTHRGPTS
jgi:hypothetical protein